MRQKTLLEVLQKGCGPWLYLTAAQTIRVQVVQITYPTVSAVYSLGVHAFPQALVLSISI